MIPRFILLALTGLLIGAFATIPGCKQEPYKEIYPTGMTKGKNVPYLDFRTDDGVRCINYGGGLSCNWGGDNGRT